MHCFTDMEGRGGGAGSGAHLAVIAGIFATSGSLLGKLAGGADASSLVSWRPIRIVGKQGEICNFYESATFFIFLFFLRERYGDVTRH